MSEDYRERFAGLPSTPLADGRQLVTAATRKAGRRGLAKLDALPPDHALHIPKCPSVHTFGMRFPLDLIWLDKRDRVVRVDRDIPARRMRVCLRARSVVETLAGEADGFTAAGVGGRDGAQVP